MNTCCPTQPFGFNFLGGKFISLIVQKFVPLWNEKYKTKLIGITTTSLFGSESQYNSMKWWKQLGSSSGTVLKANLKSSLVLSFLGIIILQTISLLEGVLNFIFCILI